MRSAVRSRLSPPTKKTFRKERLFCWWRMSSARNAVRFDRPNFPRGSAAAASHAAVLAQPKNSRRHGANEVGGVSRCAVYCAFLRKHPMAKTKAAARSCGRRFGYRLRVSVFMKSWITSKRWMGSSWCSVQSFDRRVTPGRSLEKGTTKKLVAQCVCRYFCTSIP